MSKVLQILMPMAGLGSRFADAGFKVPKPLIEVDNMPMFQKALTSLNGINVEKSFHFVIRQEHVDSQNLDKLILNALPSAQITIIPTITRGAAETAYMANDTLDQESGLIIMDCDLWFRSPGYDALIAKSLSEDQYIDGALLTFESTANRYSYAKIDKNNYVVEAAEKRVISRHAITGAYFFSRASSFSCAARKLLAEPLSTKMPEYYISFLYNILIDEGKKIKAAEVESFASFGTPQELSQYEDSTS